MPTCDSLRGCRLSAGVGAHGEQLVDDERRGVLPARRDGQEHVRPPHHVPEAAHQGAVRAHLRRVRRQGEGRVRVPPVAHPPRRRRAAHHRLHPGRPRGQDLRGQLQDRLMRTIQAAGRRLALHVKFLFCFLALSTIL
jgi:hypothetical protein